MAIPNYEQIMLPLLKYVNDESEHNMSDVIDVLTTYFKLTSDEKNLQYPTGSGFVFANRVRFARLYLLKAGLLEYPKRGYIKISARGKTIIDKNLTGIDAKYLEQFPEFIEFKKVKKDDSDKKANIESITEQTPQETIEYSYQKIKDNTSEELLTLVKKCSPNFFEKLVVDLLLKMGYGGSLKDAGQAVGKSHDGGIDGIIKEDRLGFDVIYIQAKR